MEKASTAIITVIEGEVTAKHIESEFSNIVDKNVWKRSARKIANNKFSLRFPDARMVQVYKNFKSMALKVVNAQIVVEPWSSSVGAKGELQLGWFRVRGIPSEQRSIKIVAKIRGLVGKTITIDEKTRLKGEYVRMRIACSYVKQVLAKAEGTLGLKIYDFHFEREVLEEHPKEIGKVGVRVEGPAGQPSTKKARTGDGVGQSSGGQVRARSGTLVRRNDQNEKTQNNEKERRNEEKTPGKEKMKEKMVITEIEDEEMEQNENERVQLGEYVEEEEDCDDFAEKVEKINEKYRGQSSKSSRAWLMRCNDDESAATYM
jgi:hypothetical protein